MLKSVAVNGDKHLMAGVKTNRVEVLAVDLGQASTMNDHRIEVGQKISAIGAIEKIGEKEVLVAESVQLGDGETIEVSQGMGLTLTGDIIDVKNTKIGEQDHYFAVVNVDGVRQLIDLGPTTTYKVQPKPSTKITVHGVPVRAQNHRLIMAERVQVGEEIFRIERTQAFKF